MEDKMLHIGSLREIASEKDADGVATKGRLR